METTQGHKKGYFRASIEGKELIMKPHCACGNHLEEEYFCEACRKKITCNEIRCADQATLDYVDRLLHNNASFRNFTAVLEKGT